MTELEFLQAFNRPWQTDNVVENPFEHATRPAAVLICLFRQNNALHVLFTERSSHLRHHAGQISFPGGKAEQTDKDLVDTAYREAQEEIGLAPDKLNLLGRLAPYKTISGFAVTPVVSVYQDKLNVQTDLLIDPNEVASVFTVPLAFLMDKTNYFSETVKRKTGSFSVYFIPYQNRMIWGATAGMLASLQNHIDNHRM
jgi:8-oxo-dGTP pyrophosphatase MutT (NUDIX family)